MLKIAKQIFRRLYRFSAGEIRFSLMAMISERKTKYQKRIDELREQLASGMDVDGAESQSLEIASEIEMLQDSIRQEEEKERRNKVRCF